MNCAFLVLQASCNSAFGDGKTQDVCVGCPAATLQVLTTAYSFLTKTHWISACLMMIMVPKQCSFCIVQSTARVLPVQHHHRMLTLMVLCLQGRSPFGSSFDGTPLASSAETLTADRLASGVAHLSGADSPRSSSSVATHSSDVFEGQMEVSGDAAPCAACQAMPWPCIKCHLSVNVRSTPFQKPCESIHSPC